MNDYGEFATQMLRAACPEINYEYDRVNRATLGVLTGEARLMLRVLEDALDVIHGRITAGTYSLLEKTKNANFEEAIEWFESDDTDSPFSSVNICERFGYDHSAVRKAVREAVRKAELAKKKAA